MVRDDIKTIYTGGLHMAIRDEILEEILKDYKNPEDLRSARMAFSRN